MRNPFLTFSRKAGLILKTIILANFSKTFKQKDEASPRSAQISQPILTKILGSEVVVIAALKYRPGAKPTPHAPTPSTPHQHPPHPCDRPPTERTQATEQATPPPHPVHPSHAHTPAHCTPAPPHNLPTPLGLVLTYPHTQPTHSLYTPIPHLAHAHLTRIRLGKF
jgi:hypothetical protein